VARVLSAPRTQNASRDVLTTEGGNRHGHVSHGPVSRRDLLKLGGIAAAAGAAAPPALLDPGAAQAQTPKRGGTFHLRIHVAPVHFDPQQTVAFPTMQAMSFSHSRLVKVKAGSSVKPGTQPLEPDLAESWTQPNDTTYIFKLRKGADGTPSASQRARS